MKRYMILLFMLVFALSLNAQDQASTQPRVIKQWTLSPDFTEEITIPFDTIFSLFNRYRLTDRFSPLNAYPGSYGLPFYQIPFFDRINHPEKYLYYYYYPLMYLSDRTIFMNTQTPFTEMTWSFAGQRNIAEQTFRIRHSQNVNRLLNFGLIYDIVYNLGQYTYQRAEDRNFTFFTSFTGEKYELYFSAGLNTHIALENGGIKDPDQLKDFETRDMAVNLGGLNNAKSTLKNNSILLVQRYTLGGKANARTDSLLNEKASPFVLRGTFSHIAVLESNRRTYSDNYPGAGFYDTAYIDPGFTFDSLSSRILKNTVRFDFTTDESRKFRLGGGFGIRNELVRQSQIIPLHNDNIADTAVWRHTNNALVGRLFNNIGEKFRWMATGELYFTGYRGGDFSIKGELEKSFDLKRGRATWIINGGITNTQPSFWYEQWGGNNFEWHNNMSKEFRTDLGTIFSFPGRRTELKINYALIDNYTDFGFDALPFQHTGGLSIAALSLSKLLSAWKFHLASDIVLQQSSNREILDLPLIALRSTGYFEHLFVFKSTNGRLNTQLGIEVTYHTTYHPYAWMPATGRYYRQDKTTTGNYPFINVFLNAKLKRTRMFVMLDHVNSGLMGYNYYLIPDYPMNVRMLRYGIAWTFYD